MAPGCTMPSAAGVDAGEAMAATKPLGPAEKDAIDPPGSSPDFDSSRTLEEITRSVQHVTGASGAALVLSDGKIMSCRACSGELVPPVGTRLNTDTGFTATCVRTAQVIRCDDTETDPRVDGSSCKELGIRSILAVPVFDGQQVAGVLEVLSSEPKKFTDRHATALRLLARLIETLANHASGADGLLGISTPDVTPQANGSSKASTDEVKVLCLSCGHPNPQGSQFCNHCGVILLSSPGPLETSIDFSLREGTESNVDEDLKEIYKLISGSAGLATWNEIYAKLLGNMQVAIAQDKPGTTTAEETAKMEDTVMGFGIAKGGTELKARREAAVRRSLWL